MFDPNSLPITNLLKYKRIGIAYSGGLDSQVLLHSLYALVQDKSKLFALHVNHGISEDSDIWESKCKKEAEKLGINFYSKKIRLDEKRPTEESLRDARYAIFRAWSTESDVVCTAHHKDDQIETIFFRIMRGTGLRGLRGIPSFRNEFNFNLARPLLGINKNELKGYANSKQLSWVEDLSNSDTTISRNYIRHLVFPLLNKAWPGFSKSLLYLSKKANDAQEVLDDLACYDLNSVAKDSHTLDLEPIYQLSEQRISNLINFWLSQQTSLRVSGGLLDQMVKIILGKKDEDTILLSNANNLDSHELRIFHGFLYLLPSECNQTLIGGNTKLWKLKNNLVLPTGKITFKETSNKGLCLNFLEKNITVRGRKGGERCKPFGRKNSQKLKKLLQELEIPPWLRDRLPLIYVEEELAAVGDLWICDKFHAKPGEVGVSFTWKDNIINKN